MEENRNTNWNMDSDNNQNIEPLDAYNYINQEAEENSFYTQTELHGDAPKKQEKPKHNSFGIKLAKCTAYALVFGLLSGSVFHGIGYVFDASKNETEAEDKVAIGANDSEENSSDVIPVGNEEDSQSSTDVSGIVDSVIPSVVSITNVSDTSYQDPFGFGESYSQETESGGSGIIIGQTEEELYIVTNNHVVANAKSLSVQFVNEDTATAQIKGTDADTDLAVISIPVKDIKEETLKEVKVATLGKSENLKVGQSVIAIGNALGYGQSVTSGVVSALDREVSIQDSTTGQVITNELIQTDAAINPGNSGGALLNLQGEVIGINSVKYASEEVEGMGYAIPITEAEPIIDDLINREKVDESKTAYLGISGTDVTEEASSAYGIPEGVYIAMVAEGSAAEKAGLQKGDVITGFDGKEIKSMTKLQEQLQYYEAGSEIEVTILRADNGQFEEQKVMVTLGRKN